jgi:hypothetical protein
MSERGTKVQGIVLLSVILGAAGLTFGIVSTVTLLTIQEEECPPGDDGQDCVLDNSMYLCSSEAELLAAITAIGTGDGYIWIMQDITLSAMVDLNSGGGLTIQGINSGITIDVNGDYTGFNVSNVKTCIIRDLTIDISDLDTNTLSAILISENDDDLVQIENLRIIGNTSYDGRGITIQSNYAQVEDCYIYQVDCGIYIANGTSNGVHIINNRVIDCGERLIDCYGNHTIIAENLFNGTQGNLLTVIAGHNNTFTQNHLKGDLDRCLWLNGSDFSTISYNNIEGTTITSVVISNVGIILGNDANNNTFIANRIHGFKNTGFETGYPVWIGGPEEDYNHFIGNLMYDNDGNLVDQGTGTYII